MKTLKFLILSVLLIGSVTSAKADEVRYLPHGEQSLAALISIIQSARTSVDMVYFIFEPCQVSTRAIVDAMAERAAHGVRVRLVIDAFLYKKDLQKGFTAYLAQKGIALKYYNSTVQWNPGGNLRSHIKFTVVDGRVYHTGGRNIADDYFGISATENFIDRDVLVSGSTGADAQASFNEIWDSSMVSVIKGGDVDEFNRTCAVSRTEIARLSSTIARDRDGLIGRVPARQCRNVEFHTDNPEFGSAKYGMEPSEGSSNEYLNPVRLREKRSTFAMIDIFKSVRKTLEIENWAYIPTGEIDQTLTDLRDRRIPILVITNGALAAGSGVDDAFDYIAAQYAKKHNKGSERVYQIARKGRLHDRWELSKPNAPWKIHSKVAVVDGKDAVVASYNLDPRSYHTNLESVFYAPDCPELAHDLEAQFKTILNFYEKDKNCAECNPPLAASGLEKVFGWLALGFF